MRIDIHTHFIPPRFIEDARRGRALNGVTLQQVNGAEWMIHPQGYRYPLAREFYDMEAKLQQMDKLGLDVSVLSISPPLFFYWDQTAATADFCRQANEALAKAAAESGGRLYAMATVPLQDPEAATRELERAMRELDLRGAEIGTTAENTPLDDPRYEPFLIAAEKLGAPLMLHPYYVGARPQLRDYYMTNLIGNPLETAIAGARLILSGTFDRHPNLKVVLVHAGGFLPYQIGRLDHGFKVRPETKAVVKRAPSSYLRNMHYDTITHAAVPLKFLVELVGPDCVVIGTDIPFDMQDFYFKEYLDQANLDPGALAAISSENATRLYKLA